MTLREMRRARQLSLADVQRLTGVNKGTLSKIERGLEVPSAATLASLSCAYRVDPSGWRAVMTLEHEGG